MTYEIALTALADPTRRGIFEDLCGGERSVAALARTRSVSRPAVSQHLKVLDRAGLVEVRAQGTARLYRIRPAGLDPLRQWLDTLWDDALKAYADHVREETADAAPRDQDR